MKFGKKIFKLSVVFTILFTMAEQAEALSFADYVYKNATVGNKAVIVKYIRRGYSIDAVTPDGYTALCRSVDENNYRAYYTIRNLGANAQHNCMQLVNQNTAEKFDSRYKVSASSEKTAQNGRETVSVNSSDDNTLKYAAAGVLAAGAAAGIVIWANDDDDKSSGTVKTCETGYHLVNNECQPIECETGYHLVGNECQLIECDEGYHLVGSTCYPEGECPTGQVWNGTECVAIECPTGTYLDGNDCKAIECPENTHLYNNVCIANDEVVIDNTNNDNVYGINSEREDVYNLFSSPKMPDDESTIEISNKGDGDVYGMLGKGNVSNAYVVGTFDGAENPYDEGVGTIKITDNGSGDVYGMYSKIEDVTKLKEVINAQSFNGGKAIGNIDITHTGGGKSIGVFGEVRAYNVYAGTGSDAEGTITIHGDGDIYGVSGYAAATNAVSPFYGHEAKGTINLYSTGDGDIYGMLVDKDDISGVGQPDSGKELANWFAFNAYSTGGDTVEGTINIKNTGNGNVYGMYGGEQLYNAMGYGGLTEEGEVNGTATGTINIANYGSGDVYGMYTPEPYDGNEGEQVPIIANVSGTNSTSAINLVNTGSGVVTGMRGGAGSNIINSGEININNLGSGTAVGIYGGSNSAINNSGTINIYRSAYTDTEDGIVHNPNGSTGGTAYGIYAESGAAVNNSGTITVTGAGGGTGIYLESGASLENTGKVYFNGTSGAVTENGSARDIYGEGTSRAAISLSSLGDGEIILGKGGQFFAESLSGDMSVSEKTVLGSFENEYVLDGSLQVENIDALKLNSKSALFTAKTQENSDGGYDVVMERQNFNDVLNDKEAAAFWERNYAAQNGLSLFDALKNTKIGETQELSDNLLGKDIVPNFRREDMLLYRNMSRQFNDNLFNRPDEKYTAGYKYTDISTDADGTLAGTDGYANTAYGMAKTTGDNDIVYGLGASITSLHSDYDNGSSRKSNTFALWVPVGYDFKNGVRWFSKLYAGYADGDYDRKTALRTYSSDITELQYGLGNEVRYDINLGNGYNFEPLAELNFLGIHQDGYDEGDAEGALYSGSGNIMSLEGGLGAYLAKEFDFADKGKLGLQIGGVYYVEFLDPDEGMDASLRGFDGTYKLRRNADDGRAALSARVRYDFKNIAVYGNVEKETGNNKALLIDAGVQYKF